MHIAPVLQESFDQQDFRHVSCATAQPPMLTPTQMRVSPKRDVRKCTQVAIAARNFDWLRPTPGRSAD